MADFPKPFPTPSSPAIASFNWTDIAEGTGIVKFYGFDSEDSTGTTHHLSTNAFYSTNIYSQSATFAGYDYLLKATWNFDLAPFNRSGTIQGTANFNIPWHLWTTEPAQSVAGYLQVLIQKVSGGVTTIGSVTTKEMSTGSLIYDLANLHTSLTQTHFKVGDNLRISILMYGKKTNNASAVGYGFLTHSPQNREEANSTIAHLGSTKLEAYIPFKIEL